MYTSHCAYDFRLILLCRYVYGQGFLRWLYVSIGEMPSHSHSGTAQSNGAHTHGMTISSQQSAGGSYHIRKTDSPTTETYQTTSAGAHTHTLSINNTGGGESHNNLQPYIAVYRWLRTA